MARFNRLLQDLQPSLTNDYFFVALTTKGLFKLAGVSYEVSALRAEVDESTCVVRLFRDIFIPPYIFIEGDAKLDHYSPHSIATLLKMYVIFMLFLKLILLF